LSDAASSTRLTTSCSIRVSIPTDWRRRSEINTGEAASGGSSTKKEEHYNRSLGIGRFAV
jgi:hypothetical protein